MKCSAKIWVLAIHSTFEVISGDLFEMISCL
jgi:hypothetical protein